MQDDLEQTVKRVMSDILNISVDRIDESTATDNTDTWDSANHIQLVLALEEEFGVSFDVSEFETMLSYPDIVHVVQSKL